MDLVDILRLQSCLNNQGISIGHDQHYRLARGDDPADSMHIEMVHRSVLWRAQIDAFELILSGDFSLDIFGRLCSNFNEILSDLRTHVLINLQNLELRFGYLARRLSNGCDQALPLALDSGAIAFKGGYL